jgi:alpha-tubulin suppressor-like RCC1 family protein
VSFRYAAGINKPGFNPLVAPTPSYLYDLYGWGRGTSGVLGLGNTTSYSSPKQVSSSTYWISVDSDNPNFTCAVKSDNTIWAWGNNNFGQLGIGNTTNYSSPKQIGALTTWLNVATGYACCLAVKTDGTLWSWGRGNAGKLGLGNTTNYSSPKQVGALTTWTKISIGFNAAFAIKTDGTMWSWGQGTGGILGLGNTTYYSSPKQIGALTTWASVSTCWYAASAVKTDGTLWTWGQNVGGCLGLGATTYVQPSPLQVGALTSWLKTSASGYAAFANVKTNGTLWTWGSNSNGKLGLGDVTNRSSPNQVGALTNWLEVVGGGYYMCAIKTDGTLWSWGQNNEGQLGLGDATDRSSPVQVGSSTSWYKVSPGYFSSFALQI